MGHDDDIARVNRATTHLNVARLQLEHALDEVYDSMFGDVPEWVVDDLNETLKEFRLSVIPRRRVI